MNVTYKGLKSVLNAIYKALRRCFKVCNVICKGIRKWFKVYVKMKNASVFFPCYAFVILRSKKVRVLALISGALISYWSGYNKQWLLLSSSRAQDYEFLMFAF